MNNRGNMNKMKKVIGVIIFIALVSCSNSV